MNKLRTQIIIAFNAFLLVVVGGVLLFYFFFAEKYYIMRKKEVMDAAYESICAFDLTDLRPENAEVIRELEEQSFSILICNARFEPVYSSKIEESKSLIQERVVAQKELYTGEAEASYREERNGKPIVLYGLITQEGQEYYVYINENTRVMRNGIAYANHFLLELLIVTMALGSLFAYALATWIVRPVENIQRVTNRLAQNDFSERIPDDQPNNELGGLAQDVNHMAEKIEKSMNDLSNYNYLLLRQNRDMEELEKMRKKMVGRLTHELKTPLAIISSQIELLQYEYDEEKREYYFTSAMEEIDKMSLLISTLLQNTKIEYQIENITPVRENLSKEIEKLLPKYENWLSAAHIRFASEIEPGCYAKIDRLQIEQAVNNYVMNARRFASMGGVVRISLKSEPDGCRLSVYNDGALLSEEDIEKIWVNFYQAEDVPRGSRTEIGLGLYIVKDIMHHHGGSCGAQNKRRGVEFWLKFPQ